MILVILSMNSLSILFNDSLVTSPNKLGVRKSRKFDFGFSGFDTYFISLNRLE